MRNAISRLQIFKARSGAAALARAARCPLAWLKMRLLDRYLLRELLTPFAYCLGGILMFWLSFDLYSELNEFQKNHLKVLDIVEYYLVQLPEMLVFPLLPVVLLLALLYALTNHARYHELTAMRAAGISLWRISFPYLAVGFFLSVGASAMNELWPQSAEKTQAILTRHLAPQNSSTQRQWEHKVFFTNERDHRDWKIDDYNVFTAQMVRPLVDCRLADGTHQILQAEGGSRKSGLWVFTNAVVTITRGDLAIGSYQTNLLIWPELTETPEEIKLEIKANRMSGFRQVQKARLSEREILEYRNLHPQDSPKSSMLETQLQGHYATPWTSLVVVLVALPFGAASGRRNVYVGVASSLVICFIYFITSQLAVALGSRGTLLPVVAGWGPNCLFGLGGAWLTWRVR
jgi:lipopolysaccharide export system permease protein